MNAKLGALGLKVLEKMPDSLFARVHGRLSDVSYREHRVGWQVITESGIWHVPRAMDTLRITRINGGYTRKLDRYITGSITLSGGDTVVDVGAMIGEFAAGVERDFDADVTVIEPDPNTAECLRETIRGDVIQAAAWNERTKMKFNMSNDHSESSLLAADGGKVKRINVQCERVDNLVDGPVDLLKIDAEGVEPEVVQGASNLDVKQIAVDVSPERDGESTEGRVRELLEDQGFTVSLHGDVLAGVKD